MPPFFRFAALKFQQNLKFSLLLNASKRRNRARAPQPRRPTLAGATAAHQQWDRRQTDDEPQAAGKRTGAERNGEEDPQRPASGREEDRRRQAATTKTAIADKNTKNLTHPKKRKNTTTQQTAAHARWPGFSMDPRLTHPTRPGDRSLPTGSFLRLRTTRDPPSRS